jgi:hypothetical protein
MDLTSKELREEDHGVSMRNEDEETNENWYELLVDLKQP